MYNKYEKRKNSVVRKFLLIFPAMLIIMAFTACGGKKASQTVEAKDLTAKDETNPEETPVAEEKKILTFTEEDRCRGDLILVNADHAYNFDANASLSPVRILDAQHYDYPVSNEDFRLSPDIMHALDQMIKDCDEAMGTTYTSVSSAWRSKEYQQNVWDEMAELYGEDYSEKYVAVPGYSEHHTGLALDLGIIYDDGSEGTFSESENAVWMADHSYLYGFIRRYAEDKTEITGISNEAWHFRYVGQAHAAYMYQHNLCLEEYLQELRANTSPEHPLEIDADGKHYSVYYVSGESCPEPEASFMISGDNCGGIIVTVGH